MSVDLDLAVDRTSEVPLGTQLIWKLRTRIATGELSAGARLPGIRELAELAGVNINTVRAVLARLEEQGLLITQQGRGNFVADDARPDAMLRQASEVAAAQASAVGLDPRDVAEALYVSRRPPRQATGAAAIPDTLAVPGEQGMAQRRELRTQIARLERELAELEPLAPLNEPRTPPQPRVLTTSELREARDELAARLKEVRRERQHWGYENQRARRAADAASHGRRWTAGVWTGGKPAAVSWTTA